MKKILVTVIALLMLTSVLTACGNTSGTSPEPEGTPAVSPDNTDAAGESVELEILSLKQEASAQEAFNQIFAAYQEAHPNVTFNLQSMTADNLKTTLRARLATDDLPDIVTWMKEIESEYLVDLSGDDCLSNLDSGSVNAANMIYNGSVYAMPIDNGYIAMYYNKTVLADNGVEVPTTLSEMKTACETLEANGVTPFATGAKDLSVPYMGLITLFSETVFGQNPDWSAQRDNDEVSIATDENWKLAFDLLTEYVYGYSDVNNAFNMSYDDSNAAIAQGDAAFYINGSWALSGIRTVNPDADLGLMPFPISDNPTDAKLLVFPDTALSIINGSANVDTAKDFFGFVASADAGAIWSEQVKVSSPVEGVNVEYDPIAADINSYKEEGQTTPYGDRVLRSIFTDKLWEDYSKYMLGTTDWETLSADLDTFWDKARDAEDSTAAAE